MVDCRILKTGRRWLGFATLTAVLLFLLLYVARDVWMSGWTDGFASGRIYQHELERSLPRS